MGQLLLKCPLSAGEMTGFRILTPGRFSIAEGGVRAKF